MTEDFGCCPQYKLWTVTLQGALCNQLVLHATETVTVTLLQVYARSQENSLSSPFGRQINPEHAQ